MKAKADRVEHARHEGFGDESEFYVKRDWQQEQPRLEFDGKTLSVDQLDFDAEWNRKPAWRKDKPTRIFER
jgi:hypothetical protein